MAGVFAVSHPIFWSGVYPVIPSFALDPAVVLAAGLEWIGTHKRHKEKMRAFMRYALQHSEHAIITASLFPVLRESESCSLEYATTAAWKHHFIRFQIDFAWSGHGEPEVLRVFDW